MRVRLPSSHCFHHRPATLRQGTPMTRSVATSTGTPFLLTDAARAPVQADPPVSIDHPPAPQAGSVAAWQASLGSATAVLRSSITVKADATIVQSARGAVQSAMAGAIAALDERLRTTEDGAAACELLAAVGRAHEVLTLASGTQVDTG